jgi:ribosomal protein L40E
MSLREMTQEEMKLRTDIPLMDQYDLEGWIENVLTKINKWDIETIKTRLDKELEADRILMLKNRRFKMCDKCSLTYPYHIVECHECGNNNLREFKQVWNPDDTR